MNEKCYSKLFRCSAVFLVLEVPTAILEQLWTAPELLRAENNHTKRLSMLASGDIYAFGIILHEIFGRQGPFGDTLLDPLGKDIIY